MIKSDGPFQIKFENGVSLDQIIPADERAKVALQVADQAMNGLITGLRAVAVAPQIAEGAVLYAGSLIISVSGAIHRIRFELITSRALVAAEVFNNAITYLETLNTTGRMDPEVATTTIRHLRSHLNAILPS